MFKQIEAKQCSLSALVKAAVVIVTRSQSEPFHYVTELLCGCQLYWCFFLKCCLCVMFFHSVAMVPVHHVNRAAARR